MWEKAGMKNYSVDLRQRLVAGRQRGKSAEELARQFEVCKRSVERYWKQHRETGSVAAKQRGGYRRSRLEGHDETLKSWIAGQPDLTLVQLQKRLHKELRISLGLTALWHRLQRLGLSFKKNAARRRARAA
jgi:transposase